MKDIIVKKYPVSLGAITGIYAATAPEAAKLNGKVKIINLIEDALLIYSH